MAMLILLPLYMNAQNIDSNKNKIPKDSYIEKMDQYLTFKLSVNNDLKGFLVKNTTKSDIQPNDKNVLKISANYRWLSGSISMTPKFIQGNNDNVFKGKTKASSFSLNLNFSRWIQSLSYSKVKGYYLHNTADYITGWVNGVDPYIQFPNLVYTGYYGHTAYKFNQKFSFNALSAQTERQLKSAGTFMPQFSYNYYIVDDKTPLTGLNSSQKSNNLELLLSIGYYHTFVIQKKFYIAAGIMPGAGLITTKLLTRMPSGNYTSHYTNAIYRLEGTVALGYDAERFFIGTQFVGSIAGYNQQKQSNVVISDRLTYQVFAGYRFKAPNFLKNIMDKLDEKKATMLSNKKK